MITLPAFPSHPEPSQPQSPPGDKPMAASVLVIDDDPENLDLLSELLQKLGCQVASATSGSEGLEKYRREGPFDIVFTDLGMPGMSGWEVTKQLKDIDAQIPVVLITGWGSQLAEDEIKKNKVDFILPKPFRINDITQLINQIQNGGQG